MDESIKSTLQPQTVFFRSYTAPEIVRILQDRAREGLIRTPTNSIQQIAALTVRETNSDVRVAIKALYYHALEPALDIREIFARAKHDITADLLNDLNDKNLLILKGAVEDPEKHVKSVYERYRQLSLAVGEEPFSYVYFYNSLSHLQSLGLIVLISTKVSRSYTNRIQVLFDPDLFCRIFENRFR